MIYKLGDYKTDSVVTIYKCNKYQRREILFDEIVIDIVEESVSI